MTKAKSILNPLDTAAPSLTERTIQTVRTAIKTGTLVPGELYSVYQLASDLGVSRSPVRDALLRLEETGIVRFERNKGFRIQLPGPRELTEIIAVRLALEVPAARRAASSINDERIAALHVERDAMRDAALAGDESLFMFHDQRLHGLLLDFAGNNYARKIIDNIRDAVRLVGTSTVEHRRTLVEVYEEHLPIVEAIEKGDCESAARTMQTHIVQTGRLLLRRTIEASQSNLTEESLWTELVYEVPSWTESTE
jgi:DNA-binding GntR family transcriptional regulator